MTEGRVNEEAGDVKVCLTLARARNGVIGKDGKIPWRIPGEQKHFKEITMGKPIIMGRTTFEKDIGKPLPGRTNIVLTRNLEFFAQGIVIAHGLEAALAVAKSKAEATGVEEVHVIGGAEIYAAALPFADRIYLTEVLADPDGDTSVPDFEPGDWQEVSRTCFAPRDDVPGFCYLILDRSVNASWTIH